MRREAVPAVAADGSGRGKCFAVTRAATTAPSVPLTGPAPPPSGGWCQAAPPAAQAGHGLERGNVADTPLPAGQQSYGLGRRQGRCRPDRRRRGEALVLQVGIDCTSQVDSEQPHRPCQITRRCSAPSQADGRVIEAEVKGTAPRPDGSTDFDGNCSCPVGLDCKHVAAELCAARRDRGDAPRPAPPPVPARCFGPERAGAATRGRRLTAPARRDRRGEPPGLSRRHPATRHLRRRAAGPAGGAIFAKVAAFSVTLRKDDSYGADKGVQA